MNKTFTLFLVVAALSAGWVQAETLDMSCSEVQVVSDFDVDNNAIFSAIEFSVDVALNSEGQYGWIARISNGQESYVEKDVQVLLVAPSEVNQLQQMVALIVPHIKWEDIRSVRVGNIGVNANQQDAGGIYIFELLSNDSQVLSKLVTIGWGFGKCLI